jgi:hypothetical protein
MARSLKPYGKSRAPAPSGPLGALPQAPLGGSRSEAARRLQMGAIGVVGVLLLIGLASIIKDRATQTESTAVAGAAATMSPGASSPAAADPLAEAGVVPEIPASPSTATAVPPVAATAAPPVSAPVQGDR